MGARSESEPSSFPLQAYSTASILTEQAAVLERMRTALVGGFCLSIRASMGCSMQIGCERRHTLVLFRGFDAYTNACLLRTLKNPVGCNRHSPRYWRLMSFTPLDRDGSNSAMIS